MNNPYHQFNIRPRLIAGHQENSASNYSNSYNLHNPLLGTVLLPAAGNSQQLYDAFSSPAPPPLMTVSGRRDNFGADFNQWLGSCNPRYMMSCMGGMPVVPMDMGNQPYRLPHPAAFQEAAGNVPAVNVMQHLMSGYGAMLHPSHVPVMQPELASARQTHTVSTFPGVSDVQNNLDDVADTNSGDVNIPFRQVQWAPPTAAVQNTGVPHIPYAVEIKPDENETPQNSVPSDNLPMINSVFTMAGADHANEQSTPAVYMDIAMDNGMQADKTTANMSSVDNDVGVTKSAGKAGKRRHSLCNRDSDGKVLKLSETIIMPCVVSTMPVDSAESVNYYPPSSTRDADELRVAGSGELQQQLQQLGVAMAHSSEINQQQQQFVGSTNPLREVREFSTISAIPVPEPEVHEPSNVPIDIIQITRNEQEEDSGSDEPVGSDEDVTRETEIHEHASNGGVPVDVIQVSINEEQESDSGELIGSDEDVEAVYLQPADDDNCSPNEDTNSEKSVCYEVVPTNSDALVFDMECDGQKDSDALRILLPTKKPVKVPSKKKKSVVPKQLPKLPVLETFKTSGVKHRLVAKIAGKTATPEQSDKIPTVVIDADSTETSEEEVEMPTEHRTTRRTASRSQRLAASVCKEKISASESQMETVDITGNENSLLGVPLQSSFFRFEAKSTEVFRLLSMERSFVPDNVLAALVDLVSSVNTAIEEKQSLNGDESCNSLSRIPRGGSRTLLFQCLFCPYGELSAKRVMAHVKQQHSKYASFIQRSLLPSRQILLYIYCRHCNFITYDSAALLIHFAVYHNVAGILWSKPLGIEQDPDWSPVINPEANARIFPFYCCPNCSYLDVEWNRIIQHVLKEHSDSALLGCVVRLIMIGRASKHLNSCTYARLAREEKCMVARKEIYACMSCKFFSFYPTYAFCHFVASHSHLEMLYTCAATPYCTKRCTSLEDIISHIQGVHVATRSKPQFQCTATLIDSLSSTEIDIGPGNLAAADVPVHVSYRSSPTSFGVSCGPAIEINGDDDDGSDNDVVFLDSAKSANVKPDSVSQDEHGNCADVSASAEPSSESVPAVQEVSKQELQQSCGSRPEDAEFEIVAESRREENADVMHSKTLTVDESYATVRGLLLSLIDSVCGGKDDRSVTEQNNEVDVADVSDDDVIVLDSDPEYDDVSDDVEPGGSVLSSGHGDVPDEHCDPPSELVATERDTGKREAKSNELAERDLQSGQTGEKQPERTECRPVQNPTGSRTLGTSGVDPRESTYLCKDTNPSAASAEIVEDVVSIPSDDESCTELKSAQPSVAGTSDTDSVVSVEDLASPGKDNSLTGDVASLIDNECVTESESVPVQSPHLETTSETASMDTAEDSSLPSDTANPLPECSSSVASVENSLANDDSAAGLEIHPMDDGWHEIVCDSTANELPECGSSIASVENAVANDDSATGLEIHSMDDELPQAACHSTANELTDPPINTTEQEPFASDQQNDDVDLFGDCVDFIDDMLPSLELPESPTDRLDSGEQCVFDVEEELLQLSDELSAEGQSDRSVLSVEQDLLSLSGRLTVDNDESQPGHCVELELALSTSSSSSVVSSPQDELPDVRSTIMADSVDESYQVAPDDSFRHDVVDNASVTSCRWQADTVINCPHEDATEASLPSRSACSSEMSSEGRESVANEITDPAIELCCEPQSAKLTESDLLSGDTNNAASENRFRFKSLAGFRFPAPSLFSAKPS